MILFFGNASHFGEDETRYFSDKRNAQKRNQKILQWKIMPF